MRQLIAATVLTLASLGTAIAADDAFKMSTGTWPPAGLPSADRTQTDCIEMRTMLDLALAGREAPDAPPFGAAATLRKTYLEATACSAEAKPGRTAVSCTLNGQDEVSALARWQSWQATAALCFNNWKRTDVSGQETRYLATEGTTQLVLRRLGAAVQATASLDACAGVNQMLSLAVNGRFSAGPRFTTTPKLLDMRYYSARSCHGSANAAGDGYAVSCTYGAADSATSLKQSNEALRIGQFCLAKWTTAPIANGYAFRDPTGKASLTVLKRDDLTFDVTMSLNRSKPAPGPTAVAAPNTASAPKPAPTQSKCTPYNDMILMAKLGNEGGNTPPFTSEARSLRHTYLGAQACSARTSVTGAHWVTCVGKFRDKAEADARLNLADQEVAACFDDWRRVRWPARAEFTSPIGRQSMHISKPDDDSVQYRAEYQPCDPIRDMVGSLLADAWTNPAGKITSTPGPLKMRYFGAQCEAVKTTALGLTSMSCFFPDLEKTAWRRIAEELAGTVKTCRPEWKLTQTEDSWYFTGSGNISFMVKAGNDAIPTNFYAARQAIAGGQ